MKLADGKPEFKVKVREESDRQSYDGHEPLPMAITRLAVASEHTVLLNLFLSTYRCLPETNTLSGQSRQFNLTVARGSQHAIASEDMSCSLCQQKCNAMLYRVSWL